MCCSGNAPAGTYCFLSQTYPSPKGRCIRTFKDIVDRGFKRALQNNVNSTNKCERSKSHIEVFFELDIPIQEKILLEQLIYASENSIQIL